MAVLMRLVCARIQSAILRRCVGLPGSAFVPSKISTYFSRQLRGRLNAARRASTSASVALPRGRTSTSGKRVSSYSRTCRPEVAGGLESVNIVVTLQRERGELWRGRWGSTYELRCYLNTRRPATVKGGADAPQ